MARIAVLGIGNVLMGDDALGPHVAKVLQARYRFPPHVEVIEAGTPGLDLATQVAGLEALVVVDTVKAAGAPGDLRRLDREALLEKGPMLPMNLHEPGLREALLTLEFSGGSPADVTVVGVVPGRVGGGVGLTPAVAAAVPRAVEAVLAELRRLGAPAAPRVPPEEPDLWWDRPANRG